jgi:glyoxylase-like metal-dependent hydrolase (beta-lactamase superfamily II)
MPTAPVGLPGQTYRNRLTLPLNGRRFQLIAIPRAHTDGDTMVYFPSLDIIMTGDFYRAIQYRTSIDPAADRCRGSSMDSRVIGHAGPDTKIVPGPARPWIASVIAHRDIAIAVRDRVGALVAQGKTEDEVVAAKVTADLDAKIQQAGTTGERFVRQAYADIKATR